MPSLAELQADLAAFVLAPMGTVAPASLQNAARTDTPGVAERLGVYRNNVFATLIDALAATFPAVTRLVGKDFFRYAACEYIAIHPPSSPALLAFGDRFPLFLSRFGPAVTVPYLPDVADLEFKWLEAYHAPDAVTLDATSVRERLAVPRRTSCLRLHPSARLMRSRHPVSKIWELNRRPEPIENNTRIAGEPEQLLIIRPRASVEVRRLHPGTFSALEALASHRSLSEAIAAARRVESTLDIEREFADLADGETFCDKG